MRLPSINSYFQNVSNFISAQRSQAVLGACVIASGYNISRIGKAFLVGTFDTEQSANGIERTWSILQGLGATLTGAAITQIGLRILGFGILNERFRLERVGCCKRDCIFIAVSYLEHIDEKIKNLRGPQSELCLELRNLRKHLHQNLILFKTSPLSNDLNTQFTLFLGRVKYTLIRKYNISVGPGTP